jgi:DNA-binding transcriptional regulator LsrR (DeoR family)/transcriptional regulator with XRE-family HTH domain
MARNRDQSIGEIRIGERLQEAEEGYQQRHGTTLSGREICKRVRQHYEVPLAPSTYSLIRSNRRPPTLAQLIGLSRVLEVTPEFLLGELATTERDGIRWIQRRSGLNAVQHRWLRALDALTSGVPLSPQLCESVDIPPVDPSDIHGIEEAEREIGRLAQSAVFMGVAELETTQSAIDEELSDRVRSVLIADAKLPDALRTRLQVTVVRNPVHSSFPEGGHLGPLIIGNRAIQLLGEFLERNVHAGQIGLAGGFHVASLVRQVGTNSLQWPERSYRIYPLTVEPFYKQLSLGDALVGELTYRLGAALGPHRINGYSLRAFGYLSEDGDVVLRNRSITTVLDQLREIDAAVFGVGDSLTPDGPLQRVLATQGYTLQSPEAAMADVCLNPINEDGERLPMRPAIAPENRRLSQLIGVDTEQLRRMAQIEKQKLVLLLASGPKKAPSTRAIVRGGFVSHVLCDDRLARALLDS